jgi:branched-chain amino acid transport system substrate-binding protein
MYGRTKIFLKSIVFIPIVMFVAGCTSDVTCRTIIDGDYYIGGLLPYTGGFIQGGEYAKAIQLAVEEINTQGGINGKYLGLITCDTAGDVTQGVDMAQELVEEECLGAIIGPARSVVALGTDNRLSGVLGVAIKAKKIMISPSATSPAISNLNDSGYVFRTTVSDAIQGKVLASIAKQENFKRVYILQSANDAYTQGIREVFVDSFESSTDEAATDQGVDYFEFTTETAAELLNKVNDWGAEAILLAMFPSDAAKIINEYSVFDWNGEVPVLMGPDSLKNGDLVDKVINDITLDDFIGTSPAVPEGDDYEKFETAYMARWVKEPHSFGAHSYDATYLIAIAMAGASNPANGEELKTTIYNSQPDGNTDVEVEKFKPGEWGKILAKLNASGAVDYEGAAGDQNFDAQGDVFSNISQWTFSGGNGTIDEVECWTVEGVHCSD